MEEKDLIKKLESVDLHRIEVPSRRRRLRAALLQSRYFEEPRKTGFVSLAKSRMKGIVDALIAGLGSRQPVWKTAATGMLSIVVVVLLFTQVWNVAADDRGDRFLIIPNLDLSPYTIYEPDERVSDASAQSPDYVFLVAGKEAVMMEGPEVKGEEFFFLEDQQVLKDGHGFEVTANPHLRYTVSIDDFEDEVDLAEVRLGAKGNAITSTFTFAASESGDGVAHDITITAFLDGREVGRKKARSIEVRGSSEEGEIQILVRRMSDGEETALRPQVGINVVTFTDFAFVVDFNSSITANDVDNPIGLDNPIAVDRPRFGSWDAVFVRAFAREGLYLEPLPEPEGAFYLERITEDGLPNEIAVTVEVLDEERILVSPAEGHFPSESQVVLIMGFLPLKLWESSVGEERILLDRGYTARVYVTSDQEE